MAQLQTALRLAGQRHRSRPADGHTGCVQLADNPRENPHENLATTHVWLITGASKMLTKFQSSVKETRPSPRERSTPTCQLIDALPHTQQRVGDIGCPVGEVAFLMRRTGAEELGCNPHG
jgi:hypothetical protein